MRALLPLCLLLGACTDGDEDTVATSPPTCAITAPVDGSHGEHGEPVVLRGTADDGDQDPGSLGAAWSSDQDGDLGGDPPGADGEVLHTADSLSRATHVLTLTVTDGDGDTCTDAVLYSVGTPPTVDLESPDDASVVQEGEAVTFVARVSTESGSPGDVTLDWSTDLGGSFASDGPDSSGLALFTHADLGRGDHVVTITATAPDGLYAVDWLTLDVNGLPGAATVAVQPEGATTLDDLWAQVLTDATDPDDDTVELLWSWAKDGAVVSRLDESTVPADETARGQIWTVTATPWDGHHEGSAATASVEIGNAPPTVGDVTIIPAEPATGDDLVCGWTDFDDPDGDADGSTLAWTLDGSEIGTDATLAGPLTRGDTLTCTITPHDGTDAGTAVAASVTVGNSAPAITGVGITPDDPTAADTLGCAWTGFSDADGDADASRVVWTVGSTTVGTDTTLSGAFAAGDLVSCTVTPSDGTGDGTPLSASKTIGNSPPSLVAAAITPSPASGSDTLTCGWSGWSDPDGDSDESIAVWTVDGSSVGTGPTLSSGFVGGDTVTCTVTPYDGTDTGDPVSDTVSVTNGTPEVSAVTISPDPAYVGDGLTCTWTFTDSDGDTDQSTVAWTLNGSSAGSTSALSGSVVRDDVVTCTVTPSDGTATGAAVTEELTVSNSVPSLASVQIVPTGPVASDTLTCLWSGFSDADGDADASTVLWSVNGTSAGTSASMTGGFGQGDRITCTVTPSDGTDEGILVSDEVTAVNSPPVLDAVSITPDPATASDTLSCGPGTTTDIDGTTSFTYAYTWTVEGADVGSTSTLSGAFARDETVSCTVVPGDGSDDGDPVTSDDLVIDNAPPVIESVSLSPADPTTDEVVTATVTTSDPDGDSVSVTYAWTVDGSGVGETGDSLDGTTAFDRDQVIGLSVTPDDGTDSGEGVDASSVTAANTAPDAPSVSIAPADPTEGEDDLGCQVDSDGDDADGDPVSYTMTWTVDGSAYASSWDTADTGSWAGPSSAVWPDDTVPAADLLADETWTCTATSDDGTDSGGSASASVTVASAVTVFAFASSQSIDGTTVTCSSTTTTASYTECADLQAGGLYMPNGITCGPEWSSTNSSYSDTQGFCQSLIGSSTFEVYYNCESTTTRATWYSNSWGTTSDNGYTEHVRCYY